MNNRFFIKKIISTTVFFAIFSFITFNLYDSAFALTDLEIKEAKLKEELRIIEEQQAVVEKSLNIQKSQSATLQRDVKILSDQIYSAELNIKRKNIEIEKLSQNIELKKNTVAELDEKLERNKKSLSYLIKKTNELDNTSLPEILLSNKKLSDFFANLDYYNNLQNQLEELLNQIHEIKLETEREKEQLALQQSKELDAKKEIETEKKTIDYKKTEKNQLLSVSKKSEATYQTLLEQKKAEAAKIRSALFQLRDTDGIPFGDALKYAEKAQSITGVRASFILGILKQETNIGKVDGSCVITDLKSGKTQGINTGKVFENGIHPTRDLPLLQTILAKLGRDPLQTRVSCPLSVGYGGAMGPSQFIPSTWNIFIPELTRVFNAHPDPWIPEHAIMGTALLLRDNGAAAGGYTAERNAACKYYSGSICQEGRGNIFYGNAVMGHTEELQRQIDFLKEVN